MLNKKDSGEQFLVFNAGQVSILSYIKGDATLNSSETKMKKALIKPHNLLQTGSKLKVIYDKQVTDICIKENVKRCKEDILGCHTAIT